MILAIIAYCLGEKIETTCGKIIKNTGAIIAILLIGLMFWTNCPAVAAVQVLKLLVITLFVKAILWLIFSRYRPATPGTTE